MQFWYLRVSLLFRYCVDKLLCFSIHSPMSGLPGHGSPVPFNAPPMMGKFILLDLISPPLQHQ